jgi:hypothetical protein
MKLLVIPLGAAVLLLLSACAPATGTSSAAPPAAGSSLSAPKHASSTAAIAVCSKISVSEVASASARSVYTAAHEIDGPLEGAQLYSCEYTDSATASDALDGFNLGVYRGGNPDTIMKAEATALTKGAKPLSGIGDRAQAGDGEVDVVVGTDVVVASDAVHEGDLTTVSTAQLEILARKVMALL